MAVTDAVERCTHGRGPVTGVFHGLTATHGWLRVYVRCWHCDLKVPVGWRWEMLTVGQAINRFLIGEWL